MKCLPHKDQRIPDILLVNLGLLKKDAQKCSYIEAKNVDLPPSPAIDTYYKSSTGIWLSHLRSNPKDHKSDYGHKEGSSWDT